MAQKKLWGGRFKKPTDPAVEAYTSSLAVDFRLAGYDIVGSIAHATMLGKCGIIPQADANQIVKGLEKLFAQAQKGQLKPDPAFEDVHSQIQAELSKLIGAPADKLHTARSRNDQVALDLRLFCRDAVKQLRKQIGKVQKGLLDAAEANKQLVIPGYTHLQRAQPILLAHHLLAYVEMLGRDDERLADALKRIDVLPLGSGALAGTSLPIDRAYVAKLLKFSKVSENSLDAVSDRDFAVELVATLALLGVHLSRFAEDLILWATEEFGLLELDDAFATGSSLMPQKKNPDVLELVRGQSGLVIGGVVQLLTLLKGLPLSYNRDLQWDKQITFQAVDVSQQALEVLEKFVRRLRFRAEAAEKLLSADLLGATDLAEQLVRNGVAFRQAHEIVGQVVLVAERKGGRLRDLKLSDLKKLSPHFDDESLELVNPRRSVELKTSAGGTSPDQVKQALDKWRKKLGK